MENRNLCDKCSFKTTCKEDTNGIFNLKKRRGGSLINVLVFFVAAVLITAQVFFFSVNSSESIMEDTYLTNIRLKLAAQVEKAKEDIRSKRITEDNKGISVSYYEKDSIKKFYDDIASKDIYKKLNDITVDVYHLNFTFDNDNGSGLKSSWDDQTGEGKMHKKIFPAMGENHYLIRAYTKLKSDSWLMYQVLVKRNEPSTPSTPATISTLSYEEIWY